MTLRRESPEKLPPAPGRPPAGRQKRKSVAPIAFDPQQTRPEDARRMVAEARTRCPIAHSDAVGGFYVPLRYGDIKKAAFDWRTFRSSPSIMRPVPNRPKGPPIEFDPPEHGGWRKLFADGASPAVARRIEPAVRADAGRLIDAFAGRGSCDLVAEFAEPLPLSALCHVLGLSVEKAQEVRHMTNAMNHATGDPDRMSAAFAALSAFGVAEVERRRERPQDDLLTALADATLDGKPLTRGEIGQFMVSFLAAGHSSTVNGLGALLYDVLGEPRRRELLIEQPQLIPAAVEESLRLNPPFFGFFRRTSKRAGLAGVELEEGASVYLCWGAANVDPDAFPRPDGFRLDRTERIMTFGFGIHACPGAPVARMELCVALEELLARLPDIRLEDPAAVTFEFEGAGGVAISNVRGRFTPIR